MNKHRITGCAALLALLVNCAVSAAESAPEAPGAQAAELESQAAALEVDIDKECQKAPKQARALCRQQHQQAVMRLRARAARQH